MQGKHRLVVQVFQQGQMRQGFFVNIEDAKASGNNIEVTHTFGYEPFHISGDLTLGNYDDAFVDKGFEFIAVDVFEEINAIVDFEHSSVCTKEFNRSAQQRKNLWGTIPIQFLLNFQGVAQLLVFKLEIKKRLGGLIVDKQPVTIVQIAEGVVFVISFQFPTGKETNGLVDDFVYEG